MKKECIIVGVGKYGQVYMEYLKNEYEVTGFYDDDSSLHGQSIENVKVKGNVQEAIDNESGCSVFVPIGNNNIRVKILKDFQNKGFYIPSFIHSQTIIDSSVKIGQAVYILPGTNIMPLTEIGDYSMISMGVNIAHHNIIEEGCFFSQGANIGASINLKKYTYVGIGATLMTGVKYVGQNSMIGAGAVVINDVPDNAVVAGVPAKILKFK